MWQMLRCCPIFKSCHFPDWVWFEILKAACNLFFLPTRRDRQTLFFEPVVLYFWASLSLIKFLPFFFWPPQSRPLVETGYFRDLQMATQRAMPGVSAARRLLFRLRRLWSRWWWTYHFGWVETAPRRSSLVPNHRIEYDLFIFVLWLWGVVQRSAKVGLFWCQSHLCPGCGFQIVSNIFSFPSCPSPAWAHFAIFNTLVERTPQTCFWCRVFERLVTVCRFWMSGWGGVGW